MGACFHIEGVTCDNCAPVWGPRQGGSMGQLGKVVVGLDPEAQSVLSGVRESLEQFNGRFADVNERLDQLSARFDALDDIVRGEGNPWDPDDDLEDDTPTEPIGYAEGFWVREPEDWCGPDDGSDHDDYGFDPLERL